MATIACSATLYRALAPSGVVKSSRAPGDSVRLGDWEAILADRKLVVAIEERTCLTLVLPLRPLAGFRIRLAAALRLALLACRVSPRIVEHECGAVYGASLVRRRHPRLAEAMGFAELEARLHVDGGQSEDSVQDMLNEFPYGECPASCAKEAVGLLFGRRQARRNQR